MKKVFKSRLGKATINLLLLANVSLLSGCGTNTPQTDQTKEVEKLKQENAELLEKIKVMEQNAEQAKEEDRKEQLKKIQEIMAPFIQEIKLIKDSYPTELQRNPSKVTVLEEQNKALLELLDRLAKLMKLLGISEF